MHILKLSLLALAGLSNASPDSLVNCLKPALSSNTALEYPSQEGFVQDTGRYSTLFAPSFRLVAKVTTEEDIAASIRCATHTNTTFFVTGPRHGFSQGLGQIKNGLEIYTGAFNHVEVDADTNTLTCGGATTFGDAIEAGYRAKKVFPTGSSSCVGMLGAGLGGGIGRLQGLYGLIIDNILSVRIMLPNTTVVTASEDTNPELFWGIRGAGFNFGFILNATFRVYDQVNNGMHMNADFLYPANITQSFFEKLAKEAENMPAAFSIDTGAAYNVDYNATMLIANAVYAGPEDKGRKLVQFLIDQKPLVQNITMVPWNKLIDAALFGGAGAAACEKGRYRKSLYSAGFKTIDPRAQVKMTQVLEQMNAKFPQTIGSGAAIYLPAIQAMKAVPKTATAYNRRDLLGHMNFDITYSDNTTTDATVDNLPVKMRDIIVETAGTDDLITYVGFSHGNEPLESIYSKENLPRLAALKKEIDPSGLFNAYHPLPTVYP